MDHLIHPHPNQDSHFGLGKSLPNPMDRNLHERYLNHCRQSHLHLGPYTDLRCKETYHRWLYPKLCRSNLGRDYHRRYHHQCQEQVSNCLDIGHRQHRLRRCLTNRLGPRLHSRIGQSKRSPPHYHNCQFDLQNHPCQSLDSRGLANLMCPQYWDNHHPADLEGCLHNYQSRYSSIDFQP